jgi:hypothetical protein
MPRLLRLAEGLRPSLWLLLASLEHTLLDQSIPEKFWLEGNQEMVTIHPLRCVVQLRESH